MTKKALARMRATWLRMHATVERIGVKATRPMMWFRRHRAPWPEKSLKRARSVLRDTDFLVRFIEEGTRYLLIANGAVLIATINGIGNAWQHPALQPVFKQMASDFTRGLFLAFTAWLAGKMAIKWLLKLKEDTANQDYTSETWQTWRQFTGMLWSCALAAGFSAAELMGGGRGIANALALGK